MWSKYFFKEKKKKFIFNILFLKKKGIRKFLEIRAQLLRETSDKLAQLAREKLLDARLNNNLLNNERYICLSF